MFSVSLNRIVLISFVFGGNKYIENWTSIIRSSGIINISL